MNNNKSIKRLLPLTLFVIAIIFMAGCESTDTGTGSGSAKIQIDYATDEFLKQYDSYHEYTHDNDADRIVIWTDKTIKDFSFIGIANVDSEEKLSFREERIIHAVGDLSSNKPYVVKAEAYRGIIPHIGISFLDENNNKKYCYIKWSGMDGSLSLVEF
jgi:hypothetical protein